MRHLRLPFACVPAALLLTGICSFACVTQPNLPPTELAKGVSVRVLRGWLEDRYHTRIANACLVLYGENGKRPVASLNATPRGTFNFGRLQAGNYELVISDQKGIFHPIAMPVKILRSGVARDVRIYLGTLSRRDSNAGAFGFPG